MPIFSQIGITSDHAGLALSQTLTQHLRQKAYLVEDYNLSESSQEALDYPEYASLLAQAVSEQRIQAGIALCGTGIGMAITANKFKGVRAACVWDQKSAQLSREHNQSNFLCLGARMLSEEEIIKLTETWLMTPFEGGRHQRRLKKIEEIERKNFKP